MLSLGRSAGAMARAGEGRVRREKSRPADLMYRTQWLRWPHGALPALCNGSDVTAVTVGLPARHHRGVSPAGQAGSWGRLGEAYGGVE